MTDGEASGGLRNAALVAEGPLLPESDGSRGSNEPRCRCDALDLDEDDGPDEVEA